MSSVPGAGAFTGRRYRRGRGARRSRARLRPWRKLGGAVASPSPVARHTPWEIRLCGRVAVGARDGLAGAALPGRQGQLLLAYLVCHRTRACPRYELEDVLWPERAPAASDSALSSLLSKLRRALGPDALTGRAEVRLVLPEPLWVDVEALADAVGMALQALDDRRWADAAAQARAALSVATEPFLAECDGPWVRERRREVEGLRLRALEALGEAGLRLGGRELGAAEQALRTALALAPFRESAHRLLMEVHEARGNPAEALRAFEDLRRVLRGQRGPAPGAPRPGGPQRPPPGGGPPPGAPGGAPGGGGGGGGGPPPVAAPRAPRSRARLRPRPRATPSWAATATWPSCTRRGRGRSATTGGSCSWRATPGSASRASPRSSPAPCTTRAPSSSTA